MGARNRFQFIGNLGADVETRAIPSGVSVSNLRIAVTERQKVDGEWADKTEWFRCTLWRNDGILPYLKKGAQVCVSGRIENRQYDKDGQTHYSTEFIVDDLVMLGGKRGDDSGQQQAEEPKTKRKAKGDSQGAAPFTARPADDDDVPF